MPSNKPVKNKGSEWVSNQAKKGQTDCSNSHEFENASTTVTHTACVRTTPAELSVVLLVYLRIYFRPGTIVHHCATLGYCTFLLRGIGEIWNIYLVFRAVVVGSWRYWILVSF